MAHLCYNQHNQSCLMTINDVNTMNSIRIVEYMNTVIFLFIIFNKEK